jgi:hypothetical protein
MMVVASLYFTKTRVNIITHFLSVYSHLKELDREQFKSVQNNLTKSTIMLLKPVWFTHTTADSSMVLTTEEEITSQHF